jgi:ribosome-associated translation inhibitor RaiA
MGRKDAISNNEIKHIFSLYLDKNKVPCLFEYPPPLGVIQFFFFNQHLFHFYIFSFELLGKSIGEYLVRYISANFQKLCAFYDKSTKIDIHVQKNTENLTGDRTTFSEHVFPCFTTFFRVENRVFLKSNDLDVWRVVSGWFRSVDSDYVPTFEIKSVVSKLSSFLSLRVVLFPVFWASRCA